MQKIPTLFMRNHLARPAVLTDTYDPACLWVARGEGVATRKYDGTCVLHDGSGVWLARREVKSGKDAPAGFVEISQDATTGKRVGWEPAEQSPFWRYLREALGGGDPTVWPSGYLQEALGGGDPAAWPSGTYELLGPKINGDPERSQGHWLVGHSSADRLDDAPRDFEGLRSYLAHLPYEGIVWHHPDGRMAKIKRRDFFRTAR